MLRFLFATFFIALASLSPRPTRRRVPRRRKASSPCSTAKTSPAGTACRTSTRTSSRRMTDDAPQEADRRLDRRREEALERAGRRTRQRRPRGVPHDRPRLRRHRVALEYKTVAKADSGIYLRATPQVQIWDTTKAGGKWNIGADKGSGGLYNNATGSPGRDPLVHADKPFGQWNAVSHPHGRRARRRSTSTASSSSITPGSKTSGTSALPAAPHRADPVADARRRDPLAQRLPPRDRRRGGQRHPPQARTPPASRTSSTARTSPAGPARSRTTRSRTGPSSASRRRAATSTPRPSTPTSPPASNTASRPAATTASPSATPARASRRPSPCARSKFWTTPLRNTRSSTRASTTARPTA